MRVIGTIFSAILALIAVPLFTFAACNLAIEATFFNRATYDNILDDDVIFEGLLTVALPTILAAPEAEIEFEGRDESPVQLQDIVFALQEKPDVWQEITTLLVAPDWLQDTVTQLVDVFFLVIDGDTSAIEQEVNLTDIRRRFTGESAEEASRLIISEAPDCSAEEEDLVATVINERQGSLPICNPSDAELRQQSIQLVGLWFGFIARDLRNDVVTVAQLLDIERDNARALYLLIQIDRQGRILMYLCPLALLSLIIIGTVRRLKGFGRWIGGVSIAVGVLLLAIILALQVASFGILSEILADGSNPANQFFARLASAILRSAIGASSATLLIQSGISVFIGFLLMAIAWYFGRHDDEEDNYVLITDEGDVISTATQRRVATISKPNNED